MRSLVSFVVLSTLFTTLNSQPLRVNIEAGGKQHQIDFDLSNFAVLPLAETFCRQKAAEFGITTIDDLLVTCVAPVSKIITQEASKSVNPAGIVQGELSKDVQAVLAQQTRPPATTSTTSAATATTQPPSDVHEVLKFKFMPRSYY